MSSGTYWVASHRQKHLGPQTSGGFHSIPQYDPGLVFQNNGLREENARLRRENEAALNEARTWKWVLFFFDAYMRLYIYITHFSLYVCYTRRI